VGAVGLKVLVALNVKLGAEPKVRLFVSAVMLVVSGIACTGCSVIIDTLSLLKLVTYIFPVTGFTTTQ